MVVRHRYYEKRQRCLRERSVRRKRHKSETAVDSASVCGYMSDSSAPCRGARHAKSFSTRTASFSPSSSSCSPLIDTCSEFAHARTAVSGKRTVMTFSEKKAPGVTLAGLLSSTYWKSRPLGKPVRDFTRPSSRSVSTSPRVKRKRIELSRILNFTGHCRYYRSTIRSRKRRASKTWAFSMRTLSGFMRRTKSGWSDC